MVKVPADAKVYIDGNLMASKSSRRVFQTPALLPGEKYYYEVKVEVVRDGKEFVQNRRVILNAGQSVTTEFADLDVREPAATARNDRE